MIELPPHILDVAWRAFSESRRQHLDSEALADSITAVIPLIIANAYRRTAPNAVCGDDYNLLIDLASELDGGAA